MHNLKRTEAESLISNLLLILNLMSICTSLFIGLSTDYIKPWKVLLASNLFTLLFESLIIEDMTKHDQKDLSMMFRIGFVGS